MNRVIFLLILLLTTLSAQTGYAGLNAWFHANTVAMAGSGSVVSGVASDRLNPAALSNNQRAFSFGAILYPADIRATQLGFTFPRTESVTRVTVRNLNYGIFQGYDNEGQATGTYTSGDTWISLAYARNINKTALRAGIALGGFFSSLEAFTSSALIITPGLVYEYAPLNTTVGISVQNAGWIMKNYTAYRAQLPRRLVIGFAKKLDHLPMTICADYYRLDATNAQVQLGGIITLSPAVEIRWGTTTDKLDQVTNASVQQDFFGSSSLGLVLRYDAFRFSAGSYFYGTGGWVHGLGCDIDF